MKSSKFKKRMKKNPIFNLDKIDNPNLIKILKDQAIIRNFGLFGFAISHGNEKIRNMLAGEIKLDANREKKV